MPAHWSPFFENIGLGGRLIVVLAVAVLAHIGVRLVRWASEQIIARSLDRALAKARTLNGLVTSILVFALYFGAVGVAMTEFGISLTTYLASASVIGLAVAFGSQGLVQDVISGLTIILSDMFDVGDLIEIGGQPGIVQEITMRFTILQNNLGAEVLVPNRSIASDVLVA